MGVDSADLAEAHKAPQNHSSDKKSTTDNLAIEIRRSALLRTEGTGVISDRYTWKEKGSKPEWVGLDKELQKKYARFLTEHADRLKILEEQNPEVLESDLHQHDKKLLDLFTTQVIVEGGEAVRSVKPEEIDKFLKTNEGWMVTTQLLEQEAAFMLAAIGRGAKTNPDGLLRFLRPKVIGLQPSAEMLGAVKSDPKEKQYVKTMFGIDLDSPQASEADEMTKHLLEEILFVRQEFYQKIGVPPKYLDALPEQYIYANSSNPEQTKAEWAARTQDKVAAAGGIVAADVQGNLIKYWKARSEVMTEMMQEMIRNEEASKLSFKRPLEIVGEKITERQSKPEDLSRAEGFIKQNERMAKDKGIINGIKSKPTEYSAAAKGLAKVRQDAQRDHGVSDEVSIKALIKTKENAIFNINDSNSWIARKDQLDKEEKLELQKRLDKIASDFGKPKGQDEEQGRSRQGRRGQEPRKTELQITTENDARANVKTSYDQKRADLEEETKKVVEREIGELKALRASIVGFQSQLAANSDLSKSLEDQFKSFMESYDEIAGMGLSQDDLANAKTVDEVVVKINKIHDQDVANGLAPADIKGWKDDNNNDEARRTKVLEGMMEARARKKANEDGNRTARIADFNSVITTSGGYVNESELRNMTPEQALAALNAGRRNGGLTELPLNDDNLDFVRSAIKEAQDRFPVDVVVGTADELTKYADRIIKGNTYEIGNIDISREIGVLTVAKELMERFDPIITGMMKIFESPVSTARFTETASVAGDKNYSAEEKAANLPKGYYELLDLLFDYKSNTNRGAEFKRVSAVVDQDAIRTIMGESFWPGAVPVDFNGFLTKLKTDIASKSIRQRELRLALFAMINSYKDEALGI